MPDIERFGKDNNNVYRFKLGNEILEPNLIQIGNKKWRKKIIKKVKKICDILEIDHIGLIDSALKNLMIQFSALQTKFYELKKKLEESK